MKQRKMRKSSIRSTLSTLARCSLLLTLALQLSGVKGATMHMSKIEPSTHNSTDSIQFGRAVSISGDNAIVGAWAHSLRRGAAFAYERVNGVWTNEQMLQHSEGVEDDRFSLYVAVDGNTAVMGAHGEDHDGGDIHGACYIFEKRNGKWEETKELKHDDGSAGDSLGSAVAINGDTVVVGAYRDECPGYSLNATAGAEGQDCGAAYVFVRDGETWTQQAKLVANDATAGSRLGFSTAVSGDTAVVGSYTDDNGRGAVYVFVRSGATWTQQEKLIHDTSDGIENHLLGRGVALSGCSGESGSTCTAISAAYKGPSTPPSLNISGGTAYVWVRSGTSWTEQAAFSHNDVEDGDSFGLTVDISGDLAVISNSGGRGAYVFERTGQNWNQAFKLVAHDGGTSDSFSRDVAIDGTTVLVGAPNNKVAGSVYVYEIDDDHDHSGASMMGTAFALMICSVFLFL